MITLHQLSKVFRTKKDEITAVEDVDLTISEGEIYGIIGYSGAGKSTLIRLLNMLERPTAGEVVVGGKEMSRLRGKSLRQARQNIGMVFQHFNLLWSRTVFENISFPLEIAGTSKAERTKRVNELIELVGLSERANAYPAELSGGQKQRVGIARALANDPKVLLCDEATSALDPKTTDSILDLLVDINQKLGLTIVLITHEMYVIRKICHRVAVMEDGKVVEQGNVLDVFRQPQEQITKEFVKQMADQEETLDTIIPLLKDNQGPIVKLMFLGEGAEEPVVSQLIKECGVMVNILQGKISRTKDGSYGTLFVQLHGDASQIEQAITFLAEMKVEAEVLSDV